MTRADCEDRVDPSAAARHRSPDWLWSNAPRSESIYLDKSHAKLLGVCAGIARYFGLRRWVVRAAAVLSLFMFSVATLIAYLVAGLLVLDAESAPAPNRPRRRRTRTASPTESGGLPISSVQVAFDDIERRLRRMEAHVTSGRYALHRELDALGRHGVDADKSAGRA